MGFVYQNPVASGYGYCLERRACEAGLAVTICLVEDLRSKLHLETALMPWRLLEPFFARGQLLVANEQLNLLDAAMAVAKDDQEQVRQWLTSGSLVQVSDAQAQTWHSQQAELWAVVVRPFVLVQDQASRSVLQQHGA
ncbi:MAG: DUF2288 domain-containing protein [Pseudomonadales bacterium]